MASLRGCPIWGLALIAGIAGGVWAGGSPPGPSHFYLTAACLGACTGLVAGGVALLITQFLVLCNGTKPRRPWVVFASLALTWFGVYLVCNALVGAVASAIFRGQPLTEVNARYLAAGAVAAVVVAVAALFLTREREWLTRGCEAPR